jgi:hypothetical protein
MNLNATTTTDKKRGEREILFSGAVIIKIFRKEKKKQFNKTKVVSQLLLLVLFLHPGGWRRAQVREREREREPGPVSGKPPVSLLELRCCLFQGVALQELFFFLL